MNNINSTTHIDKLIAECESALKSLYEARREVINREQKKTCQPVNACGKGCLNCWVKVVL